MKRILFVKARTRALLECRTPPMGVLYLASWLRERRPGRYDIRILDTRIKGLTGGALRDAIAAAEPDLVAVSSLTTESASMCEVVAAARAWRPAVPVIVGGPHPTQFWDDLLEDPDIDAVVRGEGELPLLELLDAWEAGRDWKGIPGVALNVDGAAVDGGLAPALQDLDSSPFPAWDLIDLDYFHSVMSMSTLGPRRYMSLLTSRGCPFACSYCHKIMGRKFRGRSPEDVLAEIDALVDRHGITDLEIIDDIFNLDYDRAIAIMSMIERRPYRLRIAFPNGLRSDLLDRRMLEAMARAGTVFISFAIETVTPRHQKQVGKNLKLDRAGEAIEIAADLGIFSNGFFMLGFPGETHEELRATIDFALKSRLHTAYFFIVTPLKDTRLFEENEDRIDSWDPTSFEAHDFWVGHTNLSAVSDKALSRYQRGALMRFYLHPLRAARLAKLYAGMERGGVILAAYAVFTGRLLAARARERLRRGRPSRTPPGPPARRPS